jgi:c-di-GMP-binding flagellar brake protein YcgR
MYQEKRAHKRVKVRVPVEIRSETNDTPIRSETADLSLGGLYTEMLFTLEIGTQVDIAFRLGDLTILAIGEVVTCDRTVGNGIRFTRMLPEDRAVLDRFLQVVESEQKADERHEDGGLSPST